MSEELAHLEDGGYIRVVPDVHNASSHLPTLHTAKAQHRLIYGHLRACNIEYKLFPSKDLI